MASDFDIRSDDFQADPAATYAHLRAKCPVAHNDSPAPFYAVSRHEDVQRLLRDYSLWSSYDGPGLAFESHEPIGPVLVSTDPPAHSAERRLIAKALRPSAIEAMETDIQRLVDDIVDGFVSSGKGDYAQELAIPVPLVVMCWMLGCDTNDVAMLRGWVVHFAAAVYSSEDEVDDEKIAAVTEFFTYFTDIITRRRADIAAGRDHPDDLLTNLITAEEDGQTLEDTQILGFIGFLLTAGSATTTVLISNVLYQLLQHPDQLAALRNDSALIEGAIEESLRFDAPVHGLFRTNVEATELQGVSIPKRSKVLALFGSANRDPAQWPEPDVFDITRDKNELRKHFSFGFGIHYCMGSPLARLETKCALRATLRWLPNVRLDGDPVRTLAAVLNGFENLPIAWDVP